jgi:hypothetical protein
MGWLFLEHDPLQHASRPLVEPSQRIAIAGL